MTYWSSGGEILTTHIGVLSLSDAEALLGLHRDEVRAAANARRPPDLARASRLARELAGALETARQWRRAGGPTPTLDRAGAAWVRCRHAVHQGRIMSSEPPIRIRSVEVLSDDWAVLRKTTFDYRRRDGRWETQVRESYDRGDGAAVLPYDPDRGTVLLVRQFRYPAYAHGHAEPLIEACAGVLDADDPETCVRREAEEELGYRLLQVRRVFDLFMSPGSVTERLALFVGRYSPADRVSAGGGEAHEGEDIEVLELGLDEALAMVDRAEIIDAKTVVLLQHAKLAGLMER